MKGSFVLGVTVAVMFGLVAVGSASAREVIRECAKVKTPHTGRYKDAKCTEVDPKHEGEFEGVEPVKKSVTTKGGTSKLIVGGKEGETIVNCTKSGGKGKILSLSQLEITTTYEGCELKGKGKVCKVEKIESKPLAVESGSVSEKEAKSKEGYLYKPKNEEKEQVFVEIPSTECNTALKVEGSLAGEAPGFKESKEGKTIYSVEGGSQKIKEISVGLKVEKVEKPSLKTAGSTDTLEQEETVLFEESVSLGS